MKENKNYKVTIQYEYLKNYFDNKVILVEAISETEAAAKGLEMFIKSLKIGSNFFNFKVKEVKESYIKEL